MPALYEKMAQELPATTERVFSKIWGKEGFSAVKVRKQVVISLASESVTSAEADNHTKRTKRGSGGQIGRICAESQLVILEKYDGELQTEKDEIWRDGAKLSKYRYRRPSMARAGGPRDRSGSVARRESETAGTTNTT